MSGVKVTVVIVNYNTRKLLAQCLDSIRAQTRDVTYEVVVVDNASMDGSVQMVAELYPWVRVVANDENAGFGRANNAGAAIATGTYLFFLNSDTILQNNAIRLFVDFYEKSAEPPGVLGCMLRNAHGRYTNSYWYFPSYGRLLRARLDKIFLIPDRRAPHDFHRTFSVDFVIGADMFMRRQVFERCGGFDERFFMNYEETDLQKEVVALGYRNYIIEGPRIVHLEGGSGKAKMASRLRVERSMYQYFAKHGGSRLALVAFYAAYTLLGLFSLPRYSAAENRRYLKRVLCEFSTLVLGSGH